MIGRKQASMKRDHGRFGFIGQSTSYNYRGINLYYRRNQGQDLHDFIERKIVEREYLKFAPADKDEKIKE